MVSNYIIILFLPEDRGGGGAVQGAVQVGHEVPRAGLPTASLAVTPLP